MFRIGVSFSLILLLFHKRPGEKRFSVVSDERLSSLAILRRHTQAQEHWWHCKRVFLSEG